MINRRLGSVQKTLNIPPTFTRTSTAYLESTKYGANIPRFNNGLIIEEATTNLLPNTAAYSDSVQTVTVQGKNLFDKATVATGKYLLPTNGTIGNTNYNNDVSAYIPVTAGSQYTISGNTYVQPAVSVGLAWFTSALVYISGTSYGGATGNGTYTAPANAAYLRYTVNAVDINTSQVELGTTATAYKTFVPNSPSPDYPSPISSNVPAGTYKISDGVDWYEFSITDDLRGIGSVVDMLNFDKIGHTGSIVKKCAKTILSGSESWSDFSPIVTTTIIHASRSIFIFSHALTRAYNSEETDRAFWANNSYLGINYNYFKVGSLAAFKTWLTTNPVTVVYQLATPTTTAVAFSKNNASTAPTIPSAYTYSPSENLIAPLTLDITSGSIYTVSCKTGTITLSGAGTGTVTPTSPITFTAGSTALTLTPAPTATYAQVELKAYSTSWQMGRVARTPQEQLTIPASTLDYREGTIEFDYMPINQPLSDMTVQEQAPKIMQIGTYARANSLTLWRFPAAGIDRIALYGNYISSSWKLSDASYYTFVISQKVRIAIRWKTANNFDVWIDGVLVLANAISSVPFTGMGNIILGATGISGSVNAIYSNIRVSNKWRTDTELAYIGELRVDQFTTYSLKLTDSLTPNTF